MDNEVSKRLSKEDLDKVAGGYIFNASEFYEVTEPFPWEILDSKGNVIDRWDTKHAAEWMAEWYGESTVELTWEQVQRLRETGSPY